MANKAGGKSRSDMCNSALCDRICNPNDPYVSAHAANGTCGRRFVAQIFSLDMEPDFKMTKRTQENDPPVFFNKYELEALL